METVQDQMVPVSQLRLSTVVLLVSVRPHPDMADFTHFELDNVVEGVIVGREVRRDMFDDGLPPGRRGETVQDRDTAQVYQHGWKGGRFWNIWVSLVHVDPM